MAALASLPTRDWTLVAIVGVRVLLASAGQIPGMSLSVLLRAGQPLREGLCGLRKAESNVSSLSVNFPVCRTITWLLLSLCLQLHKVKTWTSVVGSLRHFLSKTVRVNKSF